MMATGKNATLFILKGILQGIITGGGMLTGTVMEMPAEANTMGDVTDMTWLLTAVFFLMGAARDWTSSINQFIGGKDGEN